MDNKALWNIALLTGSGLLFGYTLFQIVARRISGRQMGASVLTSLGAVILGFSLMQGQGVNMPLGLAGSACLISGSLITATTVRRGAPRLPPWETGRIEGPRGDRQTEDG